MDCSPVTYKCPNAYCIPTRKLCDGVPDCPGQEDEKTCPLLRCPVGFYKCKGQVRCLPMSEVCDGLKQCPLHGDDESLCLLPPSCPNNCACKFSSLVCGNEEENTIINMWLAKNTSLKWKINLKIISLCCSNISFETFKLIADQTPDIRQLSLPRNKIKFADKYILLRNPFLHLIDMSQNLIKALPNMIFETVLNLRYLNISYNQLTHLSMDTFGKNSIINHLDISHNFLLLVTFGHGDKVFIVNTINLEANNISFQQRDFIKGNIYVNTLITDRPILCCIFKSIRRCTTTDNILKYCSDMLKGGRVKILYWTLGSAISLLCIFAFYLIRDASATSIFLSNNRSFSKLNIVTADTLQGIYLLITALADYQFAGTFPFRKHQWVTSWYCVGLSTIHLLGILQSFVLMGFQSIFAFVHFSSSEVHHRKANCGILSLWFILLLVLGMLNVYLNKEKRRTPFTNGVCHGLFNFINNDALTFETSISAILLIMYCASLVYTCFSLAMVKKMNTSRKCSGRINLTNAEKTFYRNTICEICFKVMYLPALTVAIHMAIVKGFPLLIDLSLSVTPLFNSIFLLVRYMSSKF